MNMVYLIGTDGAGKTTLARLIVEDLKKIGRLARHFYAQHTPVLLAPLRALARVTVLRGANRFADYGQYARKKSSAARRHILAARLYAMIWVMDYVVGTWTKLLRILAFRGEVIVDRYYVDLSVNIAVALHLSDSAMIGLARRIERYFPRAKRIVFLDVPPEVAITRKADIPSILYLEERYRRYLALAKEFGAHWIDGTKDVETVRAEVLGIVLGTGRAESGSARSAHS